MKYMVTWKIHAEKRFEILSHWCGMSPEQRAATPEGVKMIGRWHNMAEFTGVVILESDSAEAISLYLLQWNAVLDFDIAPVLDDEESAAVGSQALALQ